MHTRQKDTFQNLKGDPELLKKIVEDLFLNAGKLSPIMHWHMIDKTDQEIDNYLDENVSKELIDRYQSSYDKFYDESEKFLYSWLGENKNILTQEQLDKQLKFLSKIDTLHLSNGIRETLNKDIDWIAADLLSVVDVNILEKTIDLSKNECKIIELGGGYGRLAEAMVNIISGIKYVLIDAVPGSIMFSYFYLKEQLPDKKIGFYYNGDEYDLSKYDIYIIPSWHFEAINNEKFDIAINILSMQEMSQFHVDHYLELFNSILNDYGIIYLSNSHDYVFKGDWNYNSCWLKLLELEDPYRFRSLTELFIKQPYNCNSINSLSSLTKDYLNMIERLQNQELENNHLRSNYELLQSWVTYESSGHNIVDFLRNQKYNKVAIYGLGKIGFYVLNKLKQYNINVSYCIDKNKDINIQGVDVYSLDNDLEAVDLIIICTAYNTNQIKDLIKKRSGIYSIALSEILSQQKL